MLVFPSLQVILIHHPPSNLTKPKIPQKLTIEQAPPLYSYFVRNKYLLFKHVFLVQRFVFECERKHQPRQGYWLHR